MQLYDLIKFKWLLIIEYVEFDTVELVHRLKIDQNHSFYLNVWFAPCKRNLRLASNKPLVNPTRDGTF